MTRLISFTPPDVDMHGPMKRAARLAGTDPSDHAPAVSLLVTIAQQRNKPHSGPHRNVTVDYVAITGDHEEAHAGTVNDGQLLALESPGRLVAVVGAVVLFVAALLLPAPP